MTTGQITCVSVFHRHNFSAQPQSSVQSKESDGDRQTDRQTNVGTFTSTYTFLAIVQAVSSRSLTMKARVQSQVSPCGICCRKSGTATIVPPMLHVRPLTCSRRHTMLQIKKADAQQFACFVLCHKSILIKQNYYQGNKCRQQCVIHIRWKIWSPANHIWQQNRIRLNLTCSLQQFDRPCRNWRSHSTRLDRVYTQHVYMFVIATPIYLHDVSSRPTWFSTYIKWACSSSPHAARLLFGKRCSTYRVPEHRNSHGTYQWMQDLFRINLPWSGTR